MKIQTVGQVLAGIVSFLAMSMVAHADTFVLAAETSIQGIWFQAGTTLKTFDQGKSPTPEQGTLLRNFASGPYVWKAGTEISFDSRMNVLKGTLAEGSYNNVLLSPNQAIVFYPTGVPTTFKLGQNLKVSPYGITVDSTKDPHGVLMYPDGSIRSVTTITPFVYEVNASGGSKKYYLAAGTMQFWPAGEKGLVAGKVKQATIAGDLADFMDVVPSSTIVGFDGAGEINKLQCTATCSYRRFVLRDGGEVEVLPSGSFTLVGRQPIVAGNKTYPAGQKLLLNSDGAVIAAAAPQ